MESLCPSDPDRSRCGSEVWVSAHRSGVCRLRREGDRFFAMRRKETPLSNQKIYKKCFQRAKQADTAPIWTLPSVVTPGWGEYSKTWAGTRYATVDRSGSIPRIMSISVNRVITITSGRQRPYDCNPARTTHPGCNRRPCDPDHGLCLPALVCKPSGRSGSGRDLPGKTFLLMPS